MRTGRGRFGGPPSAIEVRCRWATAAESGTAACGATMSWGTSGTAAGTAVAGGTCAVLCVLCGVTVITCGSGTVVTGNSCMLATGAGICGGAAGGEACMEGGGCCVCCAGAVGGARGCAVAGGAAACGAAWAGGGMLSLLAMRSPGRMGEDDAQRPRGALHRKRLWVQSCWFVGGVGDSRRMQWQSQLAAKLTRPMASI